MAISESIQAGAGQERPRRLHDRHRRHPGGAVSADPGLLIDVGLAFSIALSVLILMVALWIQRPLDFSSFPTVLLIATMLRLSLNIATTRMILSHGNEGTHAAGYVIAGFSKLVMASDFVIGLIVFMILIVVNFIVIAKGAERVSEVAARFTLDAMPGKQMSIDADLRAG